MVNQITENVFKDRLSELMENREINQRELADEIGISKQTISFYVHGKRLPDIDNFSLICDFFNVSADYMLGKTESKSKDMEVSTIHKKTGLSDEAIIILSKLQNKNSELLPLLSRIIEQESINMDLEDDKDLLDEEGFFFLSYEPHASVLSNIYKSISFSKFEDKYYHTQFVVKPDVGFEIRKQKYPTKDLIIAPDGAFEIVDKLQDEDESEDNKYSIRIEINDFIRKRIDDDILYALTDLIIEYYV